MVEILERGDVRFFFRPTVQPADPTAETTLGVQAFFVVLSPAGRRRHRRVRIGRKRMPAHAQRFWARVERVGSLDRVLGAELEDEVYTTKTRGARYQPGARQIAEGCYAFVRHDDHTHFLYRVDREEPDAPEEVRVAESASHVILYERDGDARPVWTTEGGPDRLDREGEELVIVGVDEDPDHELGVDVFSASA